MQLRPLACNVTLEQACPKISKISNRTVPQLLLVTKAILSPSLHLLLQRFSELLLAKQLC